MSCACDLCDEDVGCADFCRASPLNGEAAELWEKDREEYVKKVLERTPKVAAKAAVTKAAGAKASKPTAAEAAVKKA